MEHSLHDLYDMATDAECEAAEVFYFVVNDFAGELARLGAMTLYRAAAIIAALSPRSDWAGNKLDAIAIAAGADVVSLLGAGNGLDDGYGFRDGGGPGFNAMPRDVGRALAIATGRPVRAVLGGPKVNAFWRNIVWPKRDVGIPVDRHIGRAVLGPRLSDGEISRRLGTLKRYREVEKLVELAADERGVRPITFANRLWYVMRRLRRDGGVMAMPWRPLHEPIGIEPIDLEAGGGVLVPKERSGPSSRQPLAEQLQLFPSSPA